jgi:Polyketide cyclase / dehydrase and lipid transport.
MWKTEHSEVTTASPEAVWAVLADVDHWPSWNPGYAEAHLDGPLVPGSSGTVRLANGMRRGFTLVEATPLAALVIGGAGPGASQRFLHTIEPLPSGGSRVSMAATMEGPLTPLLSRLFGKVMAGYYPTAVRQLVAAAEARPVR